MNKLITLIKNFIWNCRHRSISIDWKNFLSDMSHYHTRHHHYLIEEKKIDWKTDEFEENRRKWRNKGKKSILNSTRKNSTAKIHCCCCCEISSHWNILGKKCTFFLLLFLHIQKKTKIFIIVINFIEIKRASFFYACFVVERGKNNKTSSIVLSIN